MRGKSISIPKPLLIIVNGPPGSGKTTLARRLASDLHLPVLHRDSVAEAMFDGLDCATHGRPAMIGPASFHMLHPFAAALLAAGHSLLIEGCFHKTELATAEFLALKQLHDFEPLQIQCKADGNVLLARFLARVATPERHTYHRDLEFAEHSREVIVCGRFADLALGGQVLEMDTTDAAGYDYAGLLEQVRDVLVGAMKV